MESILLDRLSVLSHPQRMAVFRLLVRRCPDALPAGEIGRVLNLKPSTTSVYLGALTKAGLIRQERRATSLLYQFNPQAAQSVVSDLFLECCRGRPDLCPPLPSATPPQNRMVNVLFICTGNSARSILAEAILRDEAGDSFVARSAGTQPRADPNPLALETLERNGIGPSGLRSKALATFRGPTAPPQDFVFSVCDLAANEDSPPWPGQPIAAHWGLPDPAGVTGTGAEKRAAFQRTFDAVQNRIRAFAALPFARLSRVSLQHEVDSIGRMMRDA